MTDRQIAAFDFDGTITKRDTLVPFLRKYGMSRLLLSAFSTLYGKREDGWRNTLKANTLRETFSGYPLSKFEEDGREYASSLQSLYRSETLNLISDHLHAGHELVLVSGSLASYARPAATVLGFSHVIAVELSDHSGRLTGEMEGRNVRGMEKARRLRHWLGSSNTEIWAYGNSSGDKEMLMMADHAKWL